jgi:carboxymethylenebutenolidase
LPEGLPNCTGKIGAVGFCWRRRHGQRAGDRVARPRGGRAVLRHPARPEDAAKIKAPLLVHYAANDERINAGWPAYEAALKAAGVKYEMFQYAGTSTASITTRRQRI